MEAPRKSVHLYYFLNNFYDNNRILSNFRISFGGWLLLCTPKMNCLALKWAWIKAKINNGKTYVLITNLVAIAIIVSEL